MKKQDIKVVKIQSTIKPDEGKSSEDMKLGKNDNESDEKDKESSRGIQQHNFVLEITKKREKEWTTTELIISWRFIFSPMIRGDIVKLMLS